MATASPALFVTPSAARAGLHCSLLGRTLEIRPSSAIQWAGVATRQGRGLVVENVGWDPEGILAPPTAGHISRRRMQKQMAQEEGEKELQEKLQQKELEERRIARNARQVPDSDAGLVAYFAATEAVEFDYEVARLRPRLDAFIDYIRREGASLRFAVTQTPQTEKQMKELKDLEERLNAGKEKYDRMAGDMVGAKDSLARLLSSKDKKTTLLDMAESNEINLPLLALLDENIVAAGNAGQADAVRFLERIRTAVVRYIMV